MSEKITLLNIKKSPGTHFIRPTPTATAPDLVTVVAKVDGKERIIKTLLLKQETGYLYFIDKDGDVSRTEDKRNNKAPQKIKQADAQAASADSKAANSKRRDYIAVVIDTSASMKSVRAAAEKAFNSIIDSIASGASDSQEIFVSCWTFGTEIRNLCPWSPIKRSKPVISYSPRENGTRLFDAVESVLRSTDQIINSDLDSSFVVSVVTDGYNNMGKLSASEFRKIIDQYQKTDRYTLTFMLPVGLKQTFCANFGVSPGNVDEWDQTESGINKVQSNTAVGFNNYWTQRTAGTRSVKTFYTADASNIRASDLEKKMTPITDQVSVLTASKEEHLRDFCERVLGAPMLRGAAFYQLIKQEKNVQSTKMILIRDKTTNQIYSGLVARALLGLPADRDACVKPNIHPSYDIFVQSTSVNRKIPPGTSVVYWASAGVPYAAKRSSR